MVETQRFYVDGIDFQLLLQQKQLLVDALWADTDNPLWGLVNMLDDMCDIANAQGLLDYPDTDDVEDVSE